MRENPTVIDQLALITAIDAALTRFATRELVAGTELVDFLLDFRATATRTTGSNGLELETIA